MCVEAKGLLEEYEAGDISCQELFSCLFELVTHAPEDTASVLDLLRSTNEDELLDVADGICELIAARKSDLGPT